MTHLAVWAQDLHLRRNAWSKYPEIACDAYVSACAIAELAKHHCVPLILGGDIHDTAHPDQDAVMVFIEMADLIKPEMLRYVLGDHDFRSYTLGPWGPETRFNVGPWTRLARGAEHIHECSYMLGDFRCYGLDYTPAELLPAALAKIPADTDVLLTHQKWSEMMPYGGEASLCAVPHAKYVLSGDYHELKSVTVKGATGQTLLARSAGSTCMQSIGESSDKFAFLLIDSGGELMVDACQLPTRPFLRVRIRDQQELASFLETLLPAFIDSWAGNFKLPPVIRKPMVAVDYDPNIPDVYHRLVAAITPYAHFYETLVRRAQDETVVAVAPPVRGTLLPLIEAVGQCVPAGSPVHADAVRLLQSRDRVAELARMKEEFLHVAGITESA